MRGILETTTARLLTGRVQRARSAHKLHGMREPLSRLRTTFSLMFCLVLCGCASTTGPSNAWGYYWQSLRGHMQIMHAAEPIDDWVARKDISPALRERLQLA